MMKPTAATIVRLAPVLALFSCAAPKAIVVEEPTPLAPGTEIAAQPEAPEPQASEPAVRPAPADDLRLPDMMTMPGDEELRTATPGKTSPGGVIARPPTEPPSRPKPE